MGWGNKNTYKILITKSYENLALEGNLFWRSWISIESFGVSWSRIACWDTRSVGVISATSWPPPLTQGQGSELPPWARWYDNTVDAIGALALGYRLPNNTEADFVDDKTRVSFPTASWPKSAKGQRSWLVISAWRQNKRHEWGKK